MPPDCSIGKSDAQDVGVTKEENKGRHGQKAGRRAVGRRKWTKKKKGGGAKRKSYTMNNFTIYGFPPVIFCGVK